MYSDFIVRQRHENNITRCALTKQLIHVKQAFPSWASKDDWKRFILSCFALYAQWFEEGEKPTRFFFRLQNRRARGNSFNSLLKANGIEKTSQFDIEAILTKFYHDLCAKDLLDFK